MKFRKFNSIVVIIGMLFAAVASAQEPEAKQDDDELASIFGSFSIPAGYELKFAWKDFKPGILQKVELDLPPFPEDWVSRTVEQRNQWLQEFSESDAGKKFQAEQEKRLEERRVFPIDVEDDGTYSVYDVPQGDYVIEGWIVTEAKDNDKVRYRLDAFGEFKVGEVNEIELGKMDLLVHRVFAEGDEAPELNAKQFDGTPLSLADLKGNYVLVDYWASTFDSSDFMLPQLLKVQTDLAEKYKIKILSISLDDEKAAAEAFVKQHDLRWPQVYAGDWEHPSVKAFGVRSSPSFWLIDPDGHIELTNGQIMQRYSAAQSLAAVLEDKITGANKFAPPPPPEEESNDSDK